MVHLAILKPTKCAITAPHNFSTDCSATIYLTRNTGVEALQEA